MAGDSRKIPTGPQFDMRFDVRYIALEDDTGLYFPPRILLTLPVFPGRVENTYCQFSRKLFNQFENCLQIVITVLAFYKECAAWLEVTAQRSLHFPGGKCVTWKKTLNIYAISQRIFIKFSPKWYQCVWPSHFYNRSPWKCRSMSKFSKLFIFDTRIFLKKTSNVKSR